MASRVHVTVEPLPRRRKDLADAGAVAARAFMWDPFFEFLAPSALVRARGLGIFFRSVISTLGPKGVLRGARDEDGRLVGVAAWVEPGGYPAGVPLQLRSMASAFRALAPHPPALVNGTRYLIAMEKGHLKGDHWYLVLLVVDPSVQRLGVGGLLQQPMLEQADATGLPCHLETQNEDNLPYYRRVGYELAEELRPVRGGPPLWTMRRPAPAG